ncbi:MAG: SUMF1/EgtB/PvdO family nonheme iron enzyme [Lachnospiraceae bacterium]|nr:SUMF1/EgtB/PvdO family nonheme iron enzyme [Lachnospiraceae bacterium]
MTSETYSKNTYEKLKIIREKLKSYGDIFKVSIEGNEVIITYMPCDLAFVYVPSGILKRGLSENEYQQALKICSDKPFDETEMRPVTEIPINNFLVTRTPILNCFVSKYIDISYHPCEKMYASYVTKDAADFLCDKLSLRLPTENEWEYFTRAGCEDIFTFGDELPNDTELEKWLSFNFSDLSKLKCNKFGVYGLFTGEWTNTKYQKNYDVNGTKTEEFAIRGGGAYFWPWQDNEWIWCMSAMRMPSSDLIDGECGFRLVFDLN